jgi:ribonuclease HI
MKIFIKSSKIIKSYKNIFNIRNTKNIKNIKCHVNKPEIYTDGSLMNKNKMAIGVWSNYYDIQSSYKLKGLPDTNRVELAAIFCAMLYLRNKKEDAYILTDSQTSLSLINEDKHCKDKFKILVDTIKYIKNDIKKNIFFYKVKAHSKNIGNDNADRLAKLGNKELNTKYLILPDDIINKKYKYEDLGDIIDKLTKLNNIF